jgi:very-short-patch-repair endonuclease
MILPAVAGLLIIVGVLWEAFETVVLPRRVTRRFRFTVLFYRSTWRPWRAIARKIKYVKLRETFLSYFGPLSLLFLFVVYAILLVVGFGLLFYSAARHTSAALNFSTAAYLSGTTFFTLGIGDITPHTSLERVLTVTESGLGFGFLALVLSYLPVIYQAFSRREVSVVLLDARAGSPPTATELLRRHSGPHGFDALQQLLHEWEHSAAEILESHISYPVVSYFRSQHNNESWLGALAALLDATAILISSVDNPCARQARLTFAMCRHTVVDLAQIFRASPTSALSDRLPTAERLRMLWQSLTRDRRFAGLFKRQTPVGRHIPDFVSFVHRIAIELTNASESEAIVKDRAERQTWLEARDYRVLHVAVVDVERDLAAELERVQQLLSQTSH